MSSIPKSAFEFVPPEGRMHDKKLETKPVGYFRDAMNRFSRNKSSVVASYIILVLILYAILVPIFCETTKTDTFCSLNLGWAQTLRSLSNIRSGTKRIITIKPSMPV